MIVVVEMLFQVVVDNVEAAVDVVVVVAVAVAVAVDDEYMVVGSKGWSGILEEHIEVHCGLGEH